MLPSSNNPSGSPPQQSPNKMPTPKSNNSNKKGGPTLTQFAILGTYICMIMWGLQLAGQSSSGDGGGGGGGNGGNDCAGGGQSRDLFSTPATGPLHDVLGHGAPPLTIKRNNPPNAGYETTDSSSESSSLTILPHELPGYTGWARPVHSLADYFEIVTVEPSTGVATVGQNWTVVVHCNHEAAKQGGSLFYIRAFGRALLPGTVVDHTNGTYSITILPHDAGTYTLEVVLTLSQKPDYNDLPLPGKIGEPAYEGYLLPGFPITFRAIDAMGSNDNKLKEQPLCTAKQLTETSPISPLETGRWLVVNKTKHFPMSRVGVKVEKYATVEQITLDNYKNGANALGIQMEYFYKDCNVLSYEDMTSKDKWIKVLGKRRNTFKDLGGNMKKPAIHVLYVGDSNTRNQFNFFRDHIGSQLGKPKIFLKDHSLSYLEGRLKLTYIDMMGNWPETFNQTQTNIRNLKNEDRNMGDSFYVIFNAGLHEITNRCSLLGAMKGLKQDGTCHDVYRKDVRELTALIKSFPTSLRVWQSSVAGWPKWGVFGVSWPQDRGQRFPLEPNFCAYTNDMAREIMQEENIPIMDTYWMTLSRPDHREVVQKDAVRTMYKLVHLGIEVYSFLVRKFVHMIFEAIEQGETGFQYL